jgi:hypothetical protein
VPPPCRSPTQRTQNGSAAAARSPRHCPPRCGSTNHLQPSRPVHHHKPHQQLNVSLSSTDSGGAMTPACTSNPVPVSTRPLLRSGSVPQSISVAAQDRVRPQERPEELRRPRPNSCRPCPMPSKSPFPNKETGSCSPDAAGLLTWRVPRAVAASDVVSPTRAPWSSSVPSARAGAGGATPGPAGLPRNRRRQSSPGRWRRPARRRPQSCTVGRGTRRS